MKILYVDIDTLRPDHIGCYGYHRNTSPNIDQIASEGVKFSNYYCSDAPCLPSRTALMTGQFGIHNGVVGHGGTAADLFPEGINRGFKSRLSTESLPAFLRSQGLQTAYIGSFAERHGTWPFYAGYNQIFNIDKYGMESAEEVTPTALKWLEDNSDKDDWFLHVHYWDPHTPYRAPEDFGNPFKDEPLPDWLNEDILEEHRKLVGPHKPHEVNMFDNKTSSEYPRHPGEIRNMDEYRKLIDGYDTGIRYADYHLGKILEVLRAKDIYDDLVIIISSDHGENLGELGIYAEHGTADHNTCRIPMIIKWPGGKENLTDHGLHYNIDLVPTLADLFDQDPLKSWDGESYARAITDGDDQGRDKLIISQCAHVCQRGVRFDNWMYIRTYHDGYHLFPKEMLYDIEEDPHEENNLAEERPDICREAVFRLNDWHDDMMMTMPNGNTSDPLWTVISEGGPYHAKGALENYCEYLRKTGREYAIPELKERHPEEF